MAEYIHVVKSTFQPIPRASQNTVFENLSPASADNYNVTNGLASDRVFLPVSRPADPVRSDLVLERLVMPTTAGYATPTDDTAQPPTFAYDGVPSAPAPGPATWVIQKQIEPQTLEGAQREAQFIRAAMYADAVAPGWPYPLPNGSSRRIPFTSEFISGLWQSCQQVLFAESRGVPTAQRIPIRTDEGNFDRPKAEVYDNVAAAIRDLGTFDLLDINLEQAIRNAQTPAACRAALNATVYPVL
jgi:hypothetical protein